MTVIYRKRQTLFSKAETEWRVDDEALVERDPSGYERRTSWRDVTSVRLAYAPTRWKAWRYVFVLYLKSGGKIEIDNAHFAGVGDFEDRSESYTPFVRAALERVRALAPEARMRAGSSVVGYILNLLFVGSMFAILAIVIFTLPTPLDYLDASSVIKGAIVVIFLPVLIRWIVKARPQGLSLDNIPRDALPIQR
jgi:hypothetical protein